MAYAGSASLQQLVDNLTASSRNAPAMAEKIMDAAAEQIKTRMVELAPKKTGKLAASIQIVKTVDTWVIGPVGVNYAVFQEFGTATRGEFGGSSYIIKPVHANYLAFQINGKWIYTKKVVHPGIPHHPFARPALEEYVNSLGPQMANTAALAIAGQQAA